MQASLKFRALRVISFVLAIVLGMTTLGQIPAHTTTDTARVVKYGQDDIVTVHAKLRYSTLIVLPENEEILDFTTGDRDFWIINGAHNLCYIHPAQAGIRSNLNLITASGHVYSFLLEEISNEPNVEPDVKIFIEPKEQSGIGTDAFARNYVPASEAEAYQREIQTVRDQANAQVQVPRRAPNGRSRNSAPNIPRNSSSIMSWTARQQASHSSFPRSSTTTASRTSSARPPKSGPSTK